MEKTAYKIVQLLTMLDFEQDTAFGGYGAHLTHWSGAAKAINLDAGALQALIDHYSHTDEA